MPIVNREQLKELREEIYIEFSRLAELLKEQPQAYKLCYELNGRVISFSESALMLTEDRKELPSF